MLDGPYKKLIIWQKAKSLVKVVYALTKTFPADERYALTDQLRRAVVSIPSNIAEGSGRNSKKELVHFLAIARGSVYEVITQLNVAKRQNLLADIVEAESHANEIARILTTLISRNS